MPFLVGPAGAAIAGLIGGGVSAATSIYGAHTASGANDKAIAAQTAANDKALQFEQSKYNDLQGRMRPYISAGRSSSQRMADLLHLPQGGTPQPGQAPGWAGGDFGKEVRPVTLRAPNGSTKVLTDPALIAHYQQQGAEVVN